MQREQWASRTGFILAAVGSAIGLGNIWRFPYMAYENGGGAFLIPYFFAMLSAGIPFMIMEFGLGQKLRGAAPRAFSKLHSKMEFLGWFQVLIAAVIACYYVAIIGWGVSYLGFSFTQSWGGMLMHFSSLNICNWVVITVRLRWVLCNGILSGRYCWHGLSAFMQHLPVCVQVLNAWVKF